MKAKITYKVSDEKLKRWLRLTKIEMIPHLIEEGISVGEQKALEEIKKIISNLDNKQDCTICGNIVCDCKLALLHLKYQIQTKIKQKKEMK